MAEPGVDVGGGGAEIDKEVEFPVRNGSHVFGVKVLLGAV